MTYIVGQEQKNGYVLYSMMEGVKDNYLLYQINTIRLTVKYIFKKINKSVQSIKIRTPSISIIILNFNNSKIRIYTKRGPCLRH